METSSPPSKTRQVVTLLFSLFLAALGCIVALNKTGGSTKSLVQRVPQNLIQPVSPSPSPGP